MAPERSLENLKQDLRDIKRELSVPDWTNICGKCSPSIVVDLETGEIIDAMPPAEALFGYLEGELSDKHYSMLLPERFREIHGDKHFPDYGKNPIVKTMGERADELFGMRKDGGEFRISVGLYPLAPGGRRVVIVTILEIRDGHPTP